MANTPLIKFTVTKKAFYGGTRVYPGETIREHPDFDPSWAVPAELYNEEEHGEEKRLLDGDFKDIKDAVDQTEDLVELRSLVDEETSGQRRGGVLAALKDRLANLINSNADEAAEAQSQATAEEADEGKESEEDLIG